MMNLIESYTFLNPRCMIIAVAISSTIKHIVDEYLSEDSEHLLPDFDMHALAPQLYAKFSPWISKTMYPTLPSHRVQSGASATELFDMLQRTEITIGPRGGGGRGRRALDESDMEQEEQGPLNHVVSVYDVMSMALTQWESPDAFVEGVTSMMDVVLIEPKVPNSTEVGHPLHTNHAYRVLDQHSVIGIFLRKVHVAFQALPFESVSALYDDLLAYVNSYHIEEKHFVHTYQHNYHENQTYPPEMDGDLKDSPSHVHVTHRSHPTQLPFHHLNESIIEDSTREYIRYSSSVRSKDFIKAETSLHRYFDISLRKIGTYTKKYRLTQRDAHLHQSQPTSLHEHKQSDSAGVFGAEYATLSLAAMYFAFGHVHEARSALDEAINVAQKINDPFCKAQALEWLALSWERLPQREAILQVALHRWQALAEQTGEPRATEASARVILALVQNELAGNLGTRSSPADDLHTSAKIVDDFFSSQQSGAVKLAKIRHYVKMVKSISPKQPTNYVKALLLECAAWQMYGNLTMAQVKAEMADLQLIKGVSTDSDDSRKLHQFNRPGNRSTFIPDDRIRCICAIAMLESKRKSPQYALDKLITTMHRYSATKDTNEAYGLLRHVKTLLEIKSAIHVGRLGVAENILRKYQLEQDNHEPTEYLIDILEATSELRACQKRYRESLTVIDQMIKLSTHQGNFFRCMEGLLWKIECHLYLNDVSTALKDSLFVVSLSESLGFESVRSRAILLLIKSMLGYQQYTLADAALQSFQSCPPETFGHGTEHGNLLLLEGHCKAGLKQWARSEKLYAKAQAWFDEIGCALGRLEALRCRVTAADQLGEVKRRNELAASFNILYGELRDKMNEK